MLPQSCAGSRDTVLIEKELNILTLAEARANSEVCRNAMVDELKRWVAMSAWERVPKRTATNLLDSRWVLKRKKVEGSVIVKARLTARGFKDTDLSVSTFSATSTRTSQRFVLIIAVQYGFTLRSADVSQAFLRGITFKSLKDLGEHIRSVQLELPPGASALLRLLPSYHDFDSTKEVLNMLRPGYGLRDAPALWNRALKESLLSFGLVPSNIDEQLFLMHDSAGLIMAVSTHVDDLKIAGRDEPVEALIKHLELAFDALKVEAGTFCHCGIEHTQVSREWITVTQDAYVKQLRLIPQVDAKGVDIELFVEGERHTQFRALLGGVAWAGQTRPDVAVYITHLQRQSHRPQLKHLRQLNRLVRYMQLNPCSLSFRRLAPPLKMFVISDSAFRAGEVDCLAVKSCVFVLVSASIDPQAVGDVAVLPIEWLTKKQSHVCRSTFATLVLRVS